MGFGVCSSWFVITPRFSAYVNFEWLRWATPAGGDRMFRYFMNLLGSVKSAKVVLPKQ
ncbi:hypothetical protein IQ259_07540 [Fortiea sp. LEGE XX443]|uniref:hypothetical protein n=1 Tax=Fortiea sp. LEGE XX443 TaxID=1828611 RepID=UPI00187EED7B|nr:hypothetical protein [Fortiea sp. LEGE XX443]MBE9004891.1 hypothetical protein [Fortiea sp. LEGE XX443]